MLTVFSVSTVCDLPTQHCFKYYYQLLAAHPANERAKRIFNGILSEIRHLLPKPGGGPRRGAGSVPFVVSLNDSCVENLTFAPGRSARRRDSPSFEFDAPFIGDCASSAKPNLDALGCSTGEDDSDAPLCLRSTAVGSKSRLELNASVKRASGNESAIASPTGLGDSCSDERTTLPGS